MFYVKRKNKRIPVEDPIYTTCPVCGVEHPVDLVDLLRDEHTDLYGTQVYCHRCSVERAKQIIREGV